jgi:hypothetical protein
MVLKYRSKLTVTLILPFSQMCYLVDQSLFHFVLSLLLPLRCPIYPWLPKYIIPIFSHFWCRFKKFSISIKPIGDQALPNCCACNKRIDIVGIVFILFCCHIIRLCRTWLCFNRFFFFFFMFIKNNSLFLISITCRLR